MTRISSSKTFYKICLVVFLFCLLSAPSFAEWKDRYALPKIVPLSEILDKPQTWFDIPIRIPVRFCRTSNIYNPFFTRFSEERHVNFLAWDIKTPIWTQKGFEGEYPHFYMEKDNPELQTLLKLNTFDTICVMGKVISIFRDKPYIQVVWIERVPGNLHVSNLKMLNKAMKAFDERKFDQALTGLEKVLPSEPPQDIRSFIQKTRAKIYMYEKKDFNKANQILTELQLLTPLDHEVSVLLKQIEMRLRHGAPDPEPVYVKVEPKENDEKKEPEKKAETKVEKAEKIDKTEKIEQDDKKAKNPEPAEKIEK